MKRFILAAMITAFGGLAEADEGDDKSAGEAAHNATQNTDLGNSGSHAAAEGGAANSNTSGGGSPNQSSGYSSPGTTGYGAGAAAGAAAGYVAGVPGAAAAGYASGAAARSALEKPIGSHASGAGSDAGGVFRGTRDVGSSSYDEPPPSGAPLSLSDARMNFVTVVENYLARQRAGEMSNFKLQSVDKGSIEPVEGTLYKGQVMLREIASGKVKPMDFTVDFSPGLWEVKKVSRSTAVEDGEEPPVKLAPDDFYSAVRRYLSDATRKTNGVFMLKDKAGKKTWRLQFVKFRGKGPATNSDGVMVGCVEFHQSKGPGRLDVDFHAAESGGVWTIKKVILHRPLKSAERPRPVTLDRVPPT